MSDEKREKVLEFYESDQNTRTQAGKKQYKVVMNSNGDKETRQKKLFLHTLYDAHVLYLQQNPTLKVSLTTFCKLRPPHVILAGPKGTHSTCVCEIHQGITA